MASKSTINITFKLDGDSKGFKDLARDADGLKAVMTSAVVEAEKFKTSIINWNQSIQAMSAVSNAVGSLNGALQQITSESNSFSKAMRAANTMAGKGGEDFARLKDQVAELAKQIPVARDELANGLYQVISNGVPEDNWISFLEASARSSVGGIADLSQAVTVTSTIIKNYGLAWEDAQEIQDKLQLTAKNGVTTFEQLADALPTVAGSAAQLGVSIDELMAVFATCTGVTGNTAEVSTQLAAVLKSLIKPTTEATKAAEAMGISFNAAAVREAGGLDAFLKNVDNAIQQYSAKTGELSETIYGQLFGSARSLRLLTSLTGEQAQKFTENVGLMADSAGTMDKAYETMAGSVSAQTQLFQNQIATMTDVVASFIAPYQPMLNLVTQMGQLTLATTIMIRSFSQLRGGIMPIVNVIKNFTVSVGALTTAQGRATISTTGFATAATTASVGVKALSLAIKGLMITTGVGAALAILVTVIEKLFTSSQKASDKLDDLSSSEKVFKDTVTQVQGEINAEIKKLEALIAANGDTSQAVEDLNRKYGDIFGTYDTAAKWKDVLIAKSKDYVTQLGYEAQAMELGRKVAEAQIKADEALAAREGIEKAGNAQETHTVAGAGVVYSTTNDTKAYIEAKKAEEEANAELAKAQDLLDKVTKKSAEYAGRLKDAKTEVDGLGDSIESKVDKPTTKVTQSAAQLKTRYQEINEQITKLTNDYVTAGETERAIINAEINDLNDEKNAIELLQAAAARPTVLTSMRDLDAEIQYQTKLLQTASVEQADGIRQTIAALNEQRKAYTEIAEVASEPVALSEVKNIQECNDAIQYYRELQNAASADEYSNLQKTINAYQAKADSITRGADLLSMQSEVDSLSGLGKRELRIMVRAEGYESFVEKINDLRSMLNDTLNPPTDEQRAQIESLIDSYSRLGAQAAISFNTLKDGWSSVEGIGNGVKSITQALTEDGDAWTKVTTIIDSFIQIYEGINKVIDIVNALTLASQGHAVQKEIEGQMIIQEASQEVAAAGEVAAANALSTASAEAATTANVGQAASETFAAHASIPFVGIAIAAGFIATMLAVMSSLKFAKGGIAYGPTLGLFGEYAGASTNPEVVAPLDRLRSLLKTDDMQSGRVRFTIEGRTLVGVLEKEYRVSSRR